MKKRTLLVRFSLKDSIGFVNQERVTHWIECKLLLKRGNNFDVTERNISVEETKNVFRNIS